jgi:hypothetical protein
MLSRSALVLISILLSFLIADTSLAGPTYNSFDRSLVSLPIEKIAHRGPAIKELCQSLIQQLRGTMTPTIDLGRAVA